MSTEKMRNDFEQFIIRRDGSIWVTVLGDQRSYNEPIERDFSVWCESRAAIEVEFQKLNPEMFNRDVIFGHEKAREEARNSIESLGLKVKP